MTFDLASSSLTHDARRGTPPMTHAQKILDLDELATRLAELRAGGKRIVHSHGVFDLLHMGHIRHLEEAKHQGDVLVVTLTQDRHVNKGPHRPAFPEALRAEGIAALGVVDFVAINRWPTAVEAIQLLRPDVYAKGPDYKQNDKDITGGIQAEGAAIQSVGGQIYYTEDITFSSSHLLNSYFSPFPEETNAYLEAFRKKHSVDEILDWIARASEIRPLVVGEAIVDEYLYCESIGKSTKDPVLAVLQQEIQAYAGGSLAVANHLAGFCDEVLLVTQLGDQERHDELVRNTLLPNISHQIVTKQNCPTLHKRRIVDRYSGTKLLEIYLMDDRPANASEARALETALAAALSLSDAVIVADYGHGMMTPGAIERLCSSKPFLAVNAQSNAGNRGFNPISKYRRADYVCIANHEIDVETRSKGGADEDKLRLVASRIDCPRFTVTRGKAGTLHYDTMTGFFEAPSLATQVLDRVGAGDAVLAVTSLLLKAGAPWDIVAFLGNVTGAKAVADIGNRSFIDRIGLSKHVVSLLK